MWSWSDTEGSMTKVFRSNHHTLILPLVLPSTPLVGFSLPFSLGIFPQSRSDEVDLLPAFSPFVRVLLLGAHVDNLQVITPSIDVFPLVSHAVSLDGPFSGALPLHDTSSYVCAQDNDNLVTAE